MWSDRDFVSVRAFPQSGKVSMFIADVLGRCFSRAGTVFVFTMNVSGLVLVTSPKRIEIFNFVSFLYTRRDLFRMDGGWVIVLKL